MNNNQNFSKVRHTLWLALYTVLAIVCVVFAFICIDKLDVGGIGGAFVMIIMIPATIILLAVGAGAVSQICLISMDEANWFWFILSLVLTVVYIVAIVKFFAVF